MRKKDWILIIIVLVIMFGLPITIIGYVHDVNYETYGIPCEALGGEYHRGFSEQFCVIEDNICQMVKTSWGVLTDCD